MSKQALEVAKSCNVEKVYENSKGEFFTVDNLAYLSEGGKKDKVKIHDFTGKLNNPLTAVNGGTEADTAKKELEAKATKAGKEAAALSKKQGATKEQIEAAKKTAYDAVIAEAATDNKSGDDGEGGE